jgi:type I restriction enzyme, S subunit
MDARKFLAEFGHIASAPEGVQRLREMIYRLAAQGNLIGNSEGCEVKNLNLVTTFIMGQAPPAAECNTSGSGTVFVKTGEFGPLYPDVKEWTTKPLKYAKCGDVLICVVGATIGKLNLAIECAIGRSVAAIRPSELLSAHYLYYSLMPFTLGLRQESRGSAQGVIGKSELAAIKIRVPSHSEQARIVAKVDELMALCDRLEGQQRERSRLNDAARKSVLGELTTTDKLTFLSAWNRLEKNIGTLLGAPEAIDDLEACVKDLAVRGQLTPAITSIPDIAGIVQACTEQRNIYIAARWMRKQKLILAADSVIDYPANWQVVPFDEVAVVIGGVTKGKNNSGRKVVTCPYLSVANVQRGFFKLEGIKSIDISVEELGKYRVEDGDLMITEGGDWDKVGRTAIWHGTIENCLHQNHIFKARVASDHLLNEWVELVFNSGVGRDYFAGASKQTTNLASINMTQLRSFPLPIPPLVEQKAILEKLSTLTSYCKNWRSQRQQAEKLSALVAAASVSAFNGVRTEKL